ncbi:MAG: ArnT family glycosyltransferase, partial [Gemmatimonadales bacterium]
KPPLLFWQGIASTDWGHWWTLWALRFPSLLYTAATAFLVGLLATRLGADRRKGWLAALLYTGAASTFQYGRPFLTNQPETFWLFLPMVLLLAFGELSWPVVVACGLSLGIGALYKSFMLVVPVTAAFALIQWRRRGWDLIATLRQDTARLAAMAGIGLALFALWFLFDPYPGRILHQFVLSENVGKFQRGTYLKGLVTGHYNAITVIWLGDLVNFAALAPALAGLAGITLWDRWRRSAARGSDGKFLRKHEDVGDYQGSTHVVDPKAPLTAAERDLWCYVLGFLIVYTAPQQRQENYILPTVAALAVLMALRWERIPAWLLRLSGALATVMVAGLVWMVLGLPAAVPDVSYAPWQLVTLGLLLVLAISGVVGRDGAIRCRLPAAIASTWLSLGLALAPFDGPFLPAPGSPGLATLRNRTILFPSTFLMRHERFRFDVPGSQVAPYDPRDSAATDSLVRQGRLMALTIPLDGTAPPGDRKYAQRLDLRTRIPADDVRKIILDRRFDLLVRRLIIVEGPNELTP